MNYKVNNKDQTLSENLASTDYSILIELLRASWKIWTDPTRKLKTVFVILIYPASGGGFFAVLMSFIPKRGGGGYSYYIIIEVMCIGGSQCLCQRGPFVARSLYVPPVPKF